MSARYGRWGDAESTPPVSPETDTTALQVLTTLAPVAADVIADLTDPYKQAEVLKVKIARAKAAGWSPYRISLLQAKLKAAVNQIAQQQLEQQSSTEWSALGKTGVSIGIVGGVALVGLLVALAIRVSR